MALSGLFRKEAVEHQRARLWGEVILTQPLSYFAIVAIFAVILVVAGFFLTSQNYARKESVAGYLVPDAGVVRVFADQGGVLDHLYVEAGQQIQKGDPIALVKLERLSRTGVSAQLEVLESIERDLTSVELRIAEVEKQERHEREVIADRIDGLTAEREALKAELALHAERVALAEKQYDAALELAQKGYAAERLVDDRYASVLATQQAKGTTYRQIVSIDNSLQETRNSSVSLDFSFSEQRANLVARKESLTQQQANMRQVQGYTIVAPVDGVISGMLVSEGGTLRPNLPVLAIMPNGAELRAQLLVPSRAIGLIVAGQQAKIQYDAFPYQRFGIFRGKVTAVSESILTPADMSVPVPVQEAFYLVDLELGSQSVDVKGKPVPLKAGMVLKADITLENRTLIEWVLDPLFSITGKL